MTCPKCNSQQPDTAQFCSQCAQPLTASTATPKTKTPAWAWILLAFVLAALGVVALHSLNRAEFQKQAFQNSLRVNAAARQPQSHVLNIVQDATTVNATSYKWYSFVAPALRSESGSTWLQLEEGGSSYAISPERT